MKLSTIYGTIDRRLLVNFVADPSVVQKLLPQPFRPQTVNGKAIVGICLIRFKELRPKFVPKIFGLSTENAAHRIAVEWDTKDGVKTGVYIFRRDTNSVLKTILGGRVFSGVHHKAAFNVDDADPYYKVSYKTQDGLTVVAVEGEVTPELPKTSVFKSLKESSDFFKGGCTGFSPGMRKGEAEGMTLVTDKWDANAFKVSSVSSSFFDDRKLFPLGSVSFDHALIMRNIPHHWAAVDPLKTSPR